MLRSAVLVLSITACNNEGGLNRIPHPPEAQIFNLADGAEVHLGIGIIEVEGQISDSFDAPAALTAAWLVDGAESAAVLDVDGWVGLSIDTDGLDLGLHTLDLVGVDSDGMQGRARVDWTLLGPSGAPIVDITAPDDGSVGPAGDEITFRGTAQDAATPADDLDFVWSSSIDGPLSGDITADGFSVLFTDALAAGRHTITLTVTDTDGESGQDQISVTVSGEPVDAEPGDLVFSELNVNPIVVEDMFGEWVELYNTSDSTIDLAGYSFHDVDYDSYTLTSVLVPPASYVVLCASTDPAVNGGVQACDAGFVRTQSGGFGAMALGNNGDEVMLSRPDGTVIDQVVYNGSWFTPGVATGLDPTRLDAENNDDETMWCDQTSIVGGASEPGTPGEENDPCD